jgi:Zn-dependent protease
MLFAFQELIDIAVTIIATGYIFMDAFTGEGKMRYESFGNKLIFSILIAAPAIIFHEFGHKFVGLALGYKAVFHAAYMWLGIGLLLKLISFPFLFIVPAYVTISGGPDGFSHAMVAFAGPAVNLLLWLGAWAAIKWGKYSTTTTAVLYYTRTINMFLFIFNMLPIPGFDGWSFYTNII